jgi:hypothetical protein
MAIATTTTTTPSRPRLLALIAAPFRAVGGFLIRLGETSARMQEIERVRRLSDAELAARGTSRDAEIRRIVGLVV